MVSSVAAKPPPRPNHEHVLSPHGIIARQQPPVPVRQYQVASDVGRALRCCQKSHLPQQSARRVVASGVDRSQVLASQALPHQDCVDHNAATSSCAALWRSRWHRRLPPMSQPGGRSRRARHHRHGSLAASGGAPSWSQQAARMRGCKHTCTRTTPETDRHDCAQTCFCFVSAG